MRAGPTPRSADSCQAAGASAGRQAARATAGRQAARATAARQAARRPRPPTGVAGTTSPRLRRPRAANDTVGPQRPGTSVLRYSGTASGRDNTLRSDMRNRQHSDPVLISKVSWCFGALTTPRSGATVRYLLAKCRDALVPSRRRAEAAGRYSCAASGRDNTLRGDLRNRQHARVHPSCQPGPGSRMLTSQPGIPRTGISSIDSATISTCGSPDSASRAVRRSRR